MKELEFENMWWIMHSSIWVQLQSYHRMWHNITSPDRRKCENTKKIYNHILYKWGLRVITGKL